MQTKKMFRTACLGTGIAVFGLVAAAAQPATFAATRQDPDNTANNKDQSPTADNQKENPADRELAKKIRQAITSDKSLSTSAHNVKIIVQNGMVTLKGPVQSEDEKKTIEARATEIAGAGKVQNDLTVKS